MTSSYHSKVRSTQNKGVTFFFGKWTFIIIFPCLGETKVSTLNSDLTKLRWRSTFAWEHQMNYVFLTRFSYNLFTKALLLFHISLLKRFIYKILRGATISIMLTKNQVKTLKKCSFHNEKVIRNVSHACWKNALTCSISHRVDSYRFVKRLASCLWQFFSWALLHNDYFQIPTFLIDEHCSSKFSKFKMPSISITWSSSSSIATFSTGTSKIKLEKSEKLKAHRQISKNRCFENYCSCDEACQFSA